MATEAFAKYDGIEGESTDSAHRGWIELMAVSWSSVNPGGGAGGPSRLRSLGVSEIGLTLAYEKSTPTLIEKLNMGEMIPKLVIEQTTMYGNEPVTYLTYELGRVTMTSLDASSDEDESRPTVSIANRGETFTVTYTEYDSQGVSRGDVEAAWSVVDGS